MKLHGDLIFYWIRKKYPSAFSSLTKNYFVTRPMFSSRKEKQRNHFVVTEHSSGIQNVSLCADTIFLYIGFTPEELRQNVNEYIAIPEADSTSEVFNYVLEIFERFQELEENLRDAVNTYYSYNAILHSFDNLVDAPLALLDTRFRYVSYSKRLAYENKFEEKYVGEDNYMPLEQINQLNAMPDFKDLEKYQDVFQYVCVENCLHKNIFYKKEFVGRLAIPWSRDEVTNRYHTQVLTIIAAHVEALYARFGTFWRPERSDAHFKDALIQLLEGSKPDQDQIKRLLLSKGFEAQDLYCLIQFSAGFTNNGEDTSTALAIRLEGIWPGTCCFIHRSRFYALVNLTKFESATGGYLNQSLAYFLRESLLTAGVSRKFRDVFLLKTAARQTEIALEEGPLIDQTYWYFKFDDYAFSYLLKHGCHGFLPEQICHHAINILKDYDEENHTQLNLTLKTFLQLQYNAAATAKALYLARSSFLKRMSRIETLTGLRLNQYRERLYLAVSYEIMEQAQM